MNDQSVTVVGCGPVGALAALALARKGLDITLIEADSSPNLSPRAIVYLHPVLPDFKELGILDDMVARGHLDHEGFNMHLVALDEVLSAPNTLLEGISPTPFNVHMGQGELVTIVLEHLGRMPNVTVLWGTTVESVEQDESGVELGLRTGDQLSTHRTGWAIGADGGRSVLRDHIGGKLDGFTWDERFVAINLYHDYRAEGFFSSNLYVHPTLPAVIAQVNKAGLWRTTYQEDDSLPEETLEARVHEYLRELLGPDATYEVDAFSPYRMHQRLSTKLRDKRVILVGDAAHLTNPTGGLGLTTGIYDVLALAEVLPAVIGGTAGDDALDRYAADRTRVFSEISSPIASHLKGLVYGRLSPEELREKTEPMRQATATVESQQAMLMGLDSVRSPSLLS